MYKSRYKKRVNNSLKFLPFLLLFVLLVSGGVFFVRADFLKVKEVIVEGGKLVREERIQEVASSFMSGNKMLFVSKSNILFFDNKGLEEKIVSEFGGVEEVRVDKKLFSSELDIKIKERGADFVFCNTNEGGEECFNMSRDGFVFEEEGGQVFLMDKIIFRSQKSESVLRSFFDTKERVENYMKFIDSLLARNINVSSVSIDSFDESIFLTDVGKIIFNPSDDPYVAVQNAVLLIEDIKKQKPEAKFEYIDTRFGNKMFYKLI